MIQYLSQRIPWVQALEFYLEKSEQWIPTDGLSGPSGPQSKSSNPAWPDYHSLAVPCPAVALIGAGT